MEEILQDEKLMEFSNFILSRNVSAIYTSDRIINNAFLLPFSDEEIECILFGECASDVALSQGALNDASNVAVLNLARLTWTDDRKIYFSFKLHYLSNLDALHVILCCF